MFIRENWTLCIFAHGKLAQYKFTQHLIDQQVMLTTETYLHKMHQTKFHSMYFPKAYVHWTKLQNYTPMWRSPLHIFTWIDYHKVANYLLRQNLHKSFRNVGGEIVEAISLTAPPPYFQPIFPSPVRIRGSNGAITRATWIAILWHNPYLGCTDQSYHLKRRSCGDWSKWTFR